MRKIIITYDVEEVENGQRIVGETCMTIQLSDFAAHNLDTLGRRSIAFRQIEKALTTLEDLKGRSYASDSVKHIETIA